MALQTGGNVDGWRGRVRRAARGCLSHRHGGSARARVDQAGVAKA